MSGHQGQDDNHLSDLRGDHAMNHYTHLHVEVGDHFAPFRDLQPFGMDVDYVDAEEVAHKRRQGRQLPDLRMRISVVTWFCDV